jgi:hypothetical protein
MSLVSSPGSAVVLKNPKLSRRIVRYYRISMM